jgi:hypothetical protein
VSSVMVLLNSASSVIQFIILGRIDGGYGAVLVFIGLCGCVLASCDCVSRSTLDRCLACA